MTNETDIKLQLILPDGNKYVGESKNGRPNGQGTSTNPDGSKYEGEWKNDVVTNGTSYDKDGNITEKVVNGVFYDKDGNISE